MISKEELAKFIAQKIDAEVIGDYDIEVIRTGSDLSVFVDHRTNADDNEKFEVEISL